MTERIQELKLLSHQKGNRMTGKEYQKLAMRTANGRFEIINGCLGLAGETGEVLDHIKKCVYQGHELNKYKLEEELGDVMWYVALMCEALQLNLDAVMAQNIKKLEKRYPNGFEVERSVNRDEGR